MINESKREVEKKDKHENQIQLRVCKVKGIIVFVSQIYQHVRMLAENIFTSNPINFIDFSRLML